jgi:BirA family biotin operon repressor/biotin-[acetyl-CoA-carboxylase] ligase
LIKWPNDLLLRGKKVGGILTQVPAGSRNVECIVVGIGLNVNLPARLFPPSLRGTATSLAQELGAVVSRTALFQGLMMKLEQWYLALAHGEDDSLRKRWTELSRVKGRELRVTSSNGVIQGEGLGIDDDGALLLREANGMVRRVLAGDVTLGRW